MADNKKSFILYADLLATVNELTDDEAGQLFKIILKYVNDLNPVVDDRIMQLVFTPIKLQLKRDLQKWTGEREERSISGRIGNLKRWNKDLYDKYIKNEISIEDAEKVANDRYATRAIAKVANVAVTDNVNVTVNDTVTVNDIKIDSIGLSPNAPEIKNHDPVKPKGEETKKKNFAPPEKSEIVNLMCEKLDDFTAMAQADLFFNYYEANGWKVGKNKMQNWKAAAAGWISRMNNFKSNDNGKKLSTADKQSEIRQKMLQRAAAIYAAGDPPTND